MPVIRPEFQTFTREHEEVIRNEYWYDDGPPLVGMSFTAARTKQRLASFAAPQNERRRQAMMFAGAHFLAEEARHAGVVQRSVRAGQTGSGTV